MENEKRLRRCHLQVSQSPFIICTSDGHGDHLTKKRWGSDLKNRKLDEKKLLSLDKGGSPRKLRGVAFHVLEAR